MSLGFKKFLIILAVVVPLISFAVAPVRAHAVEITTDTKDTTLKGYGVNCGWNPFSSDCIAQLVYNFLFKPANYFLMGAGYIFDAILAMSINKEFIDKDFVKDIWVVIRDFSNMIFIFILLYTGIQTMFGIGNWKATVLKVVVLALIVNFSLFFTKVVIDAGNILAVGVYQGVGAEKVEGGNDPMYTLAKNKTTGNDNVKERNISGSFANAFKPQNFLLQASINSTDPITIFLIATVVNLFAAIVLLRAALIFMGRIIAFWFLMIISPFALVSMALPKGNIFQDWLSSLLNQAFVAPLFLFLLYIIMTAMNISGGIIGDTISEKSTGVASYIFDSLFVPIVIAGMIIYALNYTVKIAKDMSGSFGELGAKAITTVLSAAPVGMAANVALGGGAGILRATVGQGAGKLLQSGGRLNKMATGSGITGLIGRGLYGATERAHKGTFDVRATGIAKSGLGALKAEGVGINLGQADKAGWDKVSKQREKDAKDRAKKHEVSDAERNAKAAELDPRYRGAKASEEDLYKKEREDILAHKEAEAKEAEAQARANATNEQARVDGAQGNVANKETAHQAAQNEVANKKKSADDAAKPHEEKRATQQTDGDNLVKKLERLKKEQAEAITTLAKEEKEKEIIQAEEEQRKLNEETKKTEEEIAKAREPFHKEIEQAEKGAENAKKVLESAQKELVTAQEELAKTEEGKALAEAKKATEQAKATREATKTGLDSTRKIIKEAETSADEWKNAENERRREQIGRVETRGRLYYTNADRESFVKTVRAAKTKEARTKEKKKKDFLDDLAKVMEERKGESVEVEKPAEEGGEKK